MGIRMTQFIGLTDEAKVWLERNGQREAKTCPHCNGILETRLAFSLSDRVTCGMFAEEIRLRDFHLSNRSVARETVQRAEWSSGPVIFTCLEIDGESRFEWTEEEMDKF